MTDENKSEANQGDDAAARTIGGSQQESGGTGDPGRTPGTAEGDRQTVEEDLGERSA